MKTYHNDPAVKARLISQLEAHAAADEIVKGDYWRRGKGCAVGCTVHSGDHNLYLEMWGLPVWLAHLEDKIFEGLPNAEAKSFPLAFAQAIPVGVDLETVQHKFLGWLMDENLKRVKSLDISSELKSQVTAAIGRVRDLYAAESTDGPAWAAAKAEAWAARSAAWAARSAAWASARAAKEALAVTRAVTSAEEEAAWSAEAWVEAAEEAAAWSASAMDEVAWSAARSAAAWAALSAAWLRCRDELLRLLAEAK